MPNFYNTGDITVGAIIHLPPLLIVKVFMHKTCLYILDGIAYVSNRGGVTPPNQALKIIKVTLCRYFSQKHTKCKSSFTN